MANTVLTLTIPETKVTRILAFTNSCKPIGWEGTDKAWAKKYIINFIANDVYEYEKNVSMATAMNSISTDNELLS